MLPSICFALHGKEALPTTRANALIVVATQIARLNRIVYLHHAHRIIEGVEFVSTLDDASLPVRLALGTAILF